MGASPKALVAGSASSSTSISAHLVHVSWPHKVFHPRPQWQGLHAVPHPLRRTPHTFYGQSL
eukprot:271988-Pyramimonas_sp.AAC.1